MENSYCLLHPIDTQDKRVVPNNLLCLDENSRRLLFDSYLAELGGRGQDKSSFPLELSVKAAKSAGGTGYQRFFIHSFM